jgi:hypothetical protein
MLLDGLDILARKPIGKHLFRRRDRLDDDGVQAVPLW